jgi:hypothetical protein
MVMRAMYDAVNSSPEFNAALDEFPGVGLKPFIGIHVEVHVAEPAAKSPASDQDGDAAFLRSIRIEPLEGR